MIEFFVAIWTTRWIWIAILGFGAFMSWLTKEETPMKEGEEK